MVAMSKHAVVVRDGRIVMDEPTDLPDGTKLEVVEADPYAHLDDADELGDAERKRLHAVLEKSWARAQAGERGRSISEILELPYEIREVPDPEGGLRFELQVEGKLIATASAASHVLDDMHHLLGLTRESVAADLRASLVDRLESQLDKVTLTTLLEDPQHPLRYRCKYTYRDFNNIVVLQALGWVELELDARSGCTRRGAWR